MFDQSIVLVLGVTLDASVTLFLAFPTGEGDKTDAEIDMVGLPAHCISLWLPWCQMVQPKLDF
jgi:hypothetical protein